ncbi:MAG: hypothetical protein KGZ86_01015, partial [Candidatus Latescibacteria bacterium]|nr:hypothetical protein [Candidatus Latescibacterota bacterium]
MLEIFEKLLRLQQIDNELTILENKSKEMPRRIEGILLVSEDKKKEFASHQQHIIELKKKYKLTEVDLKETEDKISQYSTQLYSAKTNDQYKAFLKEIENQKKQKNTIEDKLIDVMDNIETTEHESKQIETEMAEIEKETQARVAVIKSEQENVKLAIEERSKTRADLCSTIGKETLAIYERIRKGKAGLAVVTIMDERCQGCLNPLPAQKILEIKKNERLHFCEYCGRIIVS